MKQKHDEWGFPIIENMYQKTEKSKINCLSFHFRNLGKEEQTMSKVSIRKKKLFKFEEKSTKLRTGNPFKNYLNQKLLLKISKIDKPLAKLVM